MDESAVKIRFVTLDEIAFRRGEVSKVARHPAMITFFVLLSGLLILLDANGTRGQIPTTAHIAGYVAKATAAILFIFLSLRVAESKAASGQTMQLNGSLICFGAALAAVLASETVITLLTGTGYLGFLSGIVLTGFYYGLAELVMVILTAYILPRLQMRLRAAENGVSGSRPDPARSTETAAPANLPEFPAGGTVTAMPVRAASSLRIGSARIPALDIRRVEAEGNYVRIVTSGARSLLPARFSHVVGQLPAHAGMMVNRSCWVAASAVVAHSRQGRDLYLHLDDGTDAKVAAGRRDAVKAWLQSMEQARARQAG